MIAELGVYSWRFAFASVAIGWPEIHQAGVYFLMETSGTAELDGGFQKSKTLI
jgi:hypothetical protein